MNQTYVLVEPAGTRLGNWMFQYAAAKCAVPDAPVTFVVPEGQDIEAVRKYQSLWPEVSYVREAPPKADVRVGFFQDAKWVARDFARRLYLEPLHDNYVGSKAGGDASGILGCTFVDSMQSISEFVSIHVRRGDYLRLPHRHPFVGEKYLREAVAQFPNAEFMVFSDDMQWCKNFFRGERFHFSEGNSVLADMYLMTKCRGGHICSNSSFSWWGAYLGEGRTVFPSLWFGPAIKDMNWNGLYFPGSDVLNNGYTVGLYLKARACIIKNAIGDSLRRLGLR